MSWVLDTNILAEIRKPKPEQRIISLLSSVAAEQLFITTIVFAEIRFGIERTLELEKRTRLQQWLAEDVRPFFGSRVLEVTEQVMLRWRQLVEDGRKSGRTYAQPDLIIAAIILENAMALVTRNAKDFAGTGVKLINPWELTDLSEQTVSTV